MFYKRPMNMSFDPSKSSLLSELKACWIYVFFGSLLSSRQCLGFSLETLHPKVFRAPQGDSHFGHRVCHFDPTQGDSVLVTAPYLNNRSGGIYSCSYSTNQCSQLHVKVDKGIALGLSLACDDHQATVCGPHYKHKCEGFNYLNGLCAEIRPRHTNTIIKPAFQECHTIPPLDAVILFDDSGSITPENFQTMIKFIKSLIGMFVDTRAQVAVAKFSTKVSAVFHFENFAVNRDTDQLMKDVTQEQGHTHTPSAIRFVLEEMFSVNVGMRNNSQKLLLVITDGKSNDPREKFNNVIPLANELGITRFAIGIGKEYLRSELEMIASSPQFVFETESFSALVSILRKLKEKIFSIEGTDTGNFSSFQMELSQGGFSVALSEGSRVFGAVGAYSWSGGIVQDLSHKLLNSSFINATNMEEDIKNSYLGYSVAVATVDGNVVYFAGAPRHRHTGIVLGFTQNHQNHTWTVSHRIYGSQLGSYFGAELCVLSASGLLAVGAPLYHTQGVGGEVRICPLHTGTLNCSGFLRGVRGNEFGRFGTSLAAVQDMNGDGFMELAVGAPQELQGKGAIYIFLGRPGGIRTEYSQTTKEDILKKAGNGKAQTPNHLHYLDTKPMQVNRGQLTTFFRIFSYVFCGRKKVIQRVSGAEVGSGLQYFGVSLHSAGDLTADALIDVVVGSKGDVTVLRTQPVMCLHINVTQDLPIIPQHFFHCAAPLGLNTPVATVTICVSIEEIVKGNIQGPFSAAVSLALELDPPARAPRLLLGNRSASYLWTPRRNLSSLFPVCTTQPIIIPECISNYHEVPLSGRLRVTGEIIPETGGLRPVLSPDCNTSFTEMVILEKVCGEDHVCVSDLNVSLSFLSDTVVSSAGYPVNLSVVVYNNGEDSTDTELFLYHPTILSFAWVKASSGKVWCVSNQTEPSNVTHTTCQLGATVFRQRVKTTLMMAFTVARPSAVNERLIVKALVTSKNENNNTVQDNRAATFAVLKLPVNVVVKNGGSTRFVKYPDSTQLEHIYMAENTGKISAPVNISFVFPVKMTFPEINGTGTTCEKQVLLKHGERFNLTQSMMPKNGLVTSILPNIFPCVHQNKCIQIKSNSRHCSVSTCYLIGCTIKLLTSDQPITFKFTGTISSGKQVSIKSWGFVFFDSERYIQYPPDDSHHLSIVTELEVPSQSLTVLIASLSVFFGLIIMAVIFVMLYKMGFFNSTSIADQNNPAAPSTGEAVNSDQTSADAPVESAQSNGQPEHITEEWSKL